MSFKSLKSWSVTDKIMNREVRNMSDIYYLVGEFLPNIVNFTITEILFIKRKFLKELKILLKFILEVLYYLYFRIQDI